jgi:isocitrate dehydrogenase
MTKDLALAIHGKELKREHYVNTQEFMDAIAKKLASIRA